jgi:hypothetical protein
MTKVTNAEIGSENPRNKLAIVISDFEWSGIRPAYPRANMAR